MNNDYEEPSALIKQFAVRSGLLDPVWYLEAYPDVAAANVDPLSHYLHTGWREGRKPSAVFDSDWYRKTHGVVGEPVAHFFQQGFKSGLSPNSEYRDMDSINRAASALGVTALELSTFLERHSMSEELLRVAPISYTSVNKLLPLKVARRLAHIENSLRCALNPTPRGIDEEGRDAFFSIVMPIFRADLGLLAAAVNSIRAQDFLSWELIMIDDGNQSEHLSQTLDHFAGVDPRIRTISRDENGGISAASNDGLAIARGEFLVLVDQDDVISPDALRLIFSAIEAGIECDIAYTDEAIISEMGELANVLAKPDWSPLLLLGGMYLGHLGAYRTDLVRDVGGFRSNFDFSQDFDLALRMSEVARGVVHIPEVCYFWRAIESSAASGGKDFARETNLKATQDALKRRGINADVVRMPRTNRVKGEPRNRETLVSLIIPTDDIVQARECLASILNITIWPNYEILFVVGQHSLNKFRKNEWSTRVKILAAAGEFNFSRKCNLGANAASGDVLVFLNDDTRPQSADWLNELLFVLELPGVGAVSPRLEYEDGSIQYAGMVTGVRGLVGTAFHKYLPSEPSILNLADSLREVSMVSGACLAIQRRVFDVVGGWNDRETPVLHSDADFSFRIRRLGLSCVYTPHASVTHIGHHSLSKQPDDTKRRDRGKASAFLLGKFPDLISRDPYFTEAIADLAHRDFPDEFRLYMAQGKWSFAAPSVLIASHDLTLSGAPRVALELAKALRAVGHRVLVVSPHDGPLRQRLQELDVSVAIDERALELDWSVSHLVDAFDVVVFNTIASLSATHNLQSERKHIVYLHEGEYLSQLLETDPNVVHALDASDAIWAVSRQTSARIKQFASKTVVVPGCAAPEFDGNWGNGSARGFRGPRASNKFVIQLLGSYEPRKGQDLAASAVRKLVTKGHQVELRCNGRVLDQDFFRALCDLATGSPGIITLGQELEHDGYVEAILSADIILVASRDEPLSLVAVDALAAGKALVISPQVGIYDYVIDGRSAFVAPSAAPNDLVSALERAMAALETGTSHESFARADYERAFSASIFANSVVKFVSDLAQSVATGPLQSGSRTFDGLESELGKSQTIRFSKVETNEARG